jgi:hypothetical protein
MSKDRQKTVKPGLNNLKPFKYIISTLQGGANGGISY